MRPFHVFLVASTLTGCVSLDSGRVAVVSLVGRLDSGRARAPAVTGEKLAGALGLAAAITRRPRRIPPRAEPLHEPEPRRRRRPCRSEALCAFEALAVREALTRIGRR